MHGEYECTERSEFSSYSFYLCFQMIFFNSGSLCAIFPKEPGQQLFTHSAHNLAMKPCNLL